MNLDNLSKKHLNELEHLIRETLAVLRQAKLYDDPLAKSLYELEQQLGEIRRKRFDDENPQYHSY
jgi:hypothetical protein